MGATADQELVELRRANAELLRERDAALTALASRNTEYGERIEYQAATIDVLKAMSASPGDPQPVFDLIAVRARDLCDAYGLTVLEFDGTLIYQRAATASATIPAFGKHPQRGSRGRQPATAPLAARSWSGKRSASMIWRRSQICTPFFDAKPPSRR